MFFKKSESRNPWSFIPTLYFAQGLPNVIITGVLDIVYKTMGIENDQITTWTSLLNFPWTLKMFWAPFVDIYLTKRKWIIFTQLLMVFCLFAAGFSFQLPSFFFLSLSLFAVAAFISATYDIAADGFYMLALSLEQQALFVGIRSVFFRISLFFATSFLVGFAAQIQESWANIPLSWTLTLCVAAITYAATFFYHQFVLPYPATDVPRTQKSEISENTPTPFPDIIKSYFLKNKIVAILAFILFYRFAEIMLGKIGKLFLLDNVAKGGLALSTKEVAIVYGTFGVASLLVGGVLGGMFISKYGLKNSFWPMALALNLPDVFYVYMAYVHPPIQWVYLLVSIEQFGYGFGFTAFMVYLMYICTGEYKTSHYAVSTGLMAFGKMFAEYISGPIQIKVGYPVFFIIVCLLTIPGMLTILFIPFNEERTR